VTSLSFPFVSVVMPVRNEAAFLARSLGSILEQDYPHSRMEVLLMDGMSTDGTRSEVERLATLTDIPVVLLENPGRIAPTALNVGLSRARGDVIVRIDGHTIVAKNYVSQCVLALSRSGADNVGGRMQAVSETRFGTAVALATSSAFGVGGARFHYSEREEWVDTVYMGCWPRGVFDRAGLFDEEMVRNQDDEFNYRILQRGGRILLSPEIRSVYYTRTTLKALWRQYFQYGFWKVRVLQKHPRQMSPRHFAPPFLVAAVLTGLFLGAIGLGWGWMGGLLALYFLASGTASVGVARRGGWRMLPLLSIAFATLHLAYGSGFLVGLAKFWNRWSPRSFHLISREPLNVSGVSVTDGRRSASHE